MRPVELPQAITAPARLSPGTVRMTLPVSRTRLPVWDCFPAEKPTIGGSNER